MAHMHIDTSDPREWTIVSHFRANAADGTSMMAWKESIVASGVVGATVLPVGSGDGMTISPKEKAGVESGRILEHVGCFSMEGTDNTQEQVEAALRKHYRDALAELCRHVSRHTGRGRMELYPGRPK